MKRKIFIRILYVLCALWIVFILAIYVFSLHYKDYVIRLLKEYSEQYLNTEISIRKDDIRFSILKRFSYPRLDLDNILIKSAPGPDYTKFEYQAKDTLMFAKRISLIFNLKSFLTKQYEITRIEIYNASLNILIDQKGAVNYTIFKPSEDTTRKDSVILDLKKILLKNINTHYLSLQERIDFSTILTQGKLSGSFGKDDFTISLQTKLHNCGLTILGKNYLNKPDCSIEASILKDKNEYLIQNGKISISGIEINLSAVINKSTQKYSVKFENSSIPIQRFQQPSFNPFLQKTGFMPKKGTLSIQGTIKGSSSKGPPSIHVEYKVLKTKLIHTKRNIVIDDLFMQGSFDYKNQGKSKSSLLKINSLSVKSGKTIITGFAEIAGFKPLSFSGTLQGNFELEKLSLFETVKNRFEMSGMVDSYLKIEGILSDPGNISKRDLKNIIVSGHFTSGKATIKSLINPLPYAIVSGTLKLNNLQELHLENILLKTGKSQLMINGTVADQYFGEKSIGFMPVYRCDVRSDEFHVEDFFLPQRNKESSAFSLPDSLIVYANFFAKKFYFGKFFASQVEGELSYTPKILKIHKFSMEHHDGKTYSEIEITQQKDLIISQCDASLVHIDIGDLFAAVNNFGQGVIQSDNIDGKISGKVSVTAVWNSELKPILDKLNVSSQLSIQKGELIEYKPLLGLSRFIKIEELKHIRFEELMANLEIHEQTLFISQTDIRSSAINLTGSGEHHFDNSYVYKIQLQLSDVLWKKAKTNKPENTEFGYVVDDGLGRTTLPLIIQGKDTIYNVTYDKRIGKQIFQSKIKQEKDVLKDLFTGPSQQQKVNDDNLFRISHEELPDSHSYTLPEKESETEPDKKETDQEDYIIQWSDE